MKIRKGKSIAAAVVMLLVIISVCLIMMPYKLTAQKRVEDFEYVCNTIDDTLYQLKDYEQLYGISYESLKEEYSELIADCQDDAEFYYLLKSFLNAVPSVHTKLAFPNENTYAQLGGYNSAQQIKRFGVKKQAEYFASTLAKNACEYADAKLYLANYMDGRYYFLSADCDKIIEIDSINGQNPDSFITGIQSGFKIRYDHINSKPFYPAVVFNDKYGEKSEIIGHYTDGTKVKLDLYYSVYAADVISWTEKDYENRKVKMGGNSTTDPYRLYIDEENDISYIAITSFDADSADEIKEKTKLAAQCQSVIVDLRGNIGGYTRTEINGLFAPLFKDDVVFENTFNFRVNKFTDSITPIITISDSVIKQAIEIKENYGTFSEKFFVFGESEKLHDLYILIDYDTISAGDEAASLIKQYNLGMLIGNNTAGEGRTGSYLTTVLPNSRLVFSYCFGYNCVDENRDNSVYGTAPDIYVQNGINEYMRKLLLEDSLAYENRLKWDNVLIETLEIIKEKKNAR